MSTKMGVERLTWSRRNLLLPWQLTAAVALVTMAAGG
jgi:hypothetical protein